MKWINTMISALKSLSWNERWIHGILWLLGLVIVNWPGQPITIGIFHRIGFQLLIPSLYGSLLNAILFYGVISCLLANARNFNGQLLIKTLSLFTVITLLESLIDVLHYRIWIDILNLELIQEDLLTNIMINFFFFYAPSLTYGIVKSALAKDTGSHRITVQDGHQIVYIKTQDLLYLESDGNYVKFHQRDKVVLERATLIQVLERLPPLFVRCHKSFIVNTDLIDQKSSGEIEIEGRSIPIGRKFKENFKLP